ncbi:hypothetical protein apy_11660 [Aeropyrum pernix]|uniref:Transposase n=1 Tax=Aeropyrum pernix TaxID=56636 RepID=A0A401HAG3_AERPX|nr:hypothetical protein apy_11660 [Aeropyrum pernix]
MGYTPAIISAKNTIVKASINFIFSFWKTLTIIAIKSGIIAYAMAVVKSRCDINIDNAGLRAYIRDNTIDVMYFMRKRYLKLRKGHIKDSTIAMNAKASTAYKLFNPADRYPKIITMIPGVSGLSHSTPKADGAIV